MFKNGKITGNLSQAFCLKVVKLQGMLFSSSTFLLSSSKYMKPTRLRYLHSVQVALNATYPDRADDSRDAGEVGNA